MGTTISDLLAQTPMTPMKTSQSQTRQSQTNSEETRPKLGTPSSPSVSISGELLLVTKDFGQLFEALRGTEEAMHHAVGVATDGRGEMRILIHGLTAETFTIR